jgi:hypothetical protein
MDDLHNYMECVMEECVHFTYRARRDVEGKEQMGFQQVWPWGPAP